MKTVDELLDSVKAKHGITSDYKLAQFLGLTLGAISHYRHGRSLPDERACQRIAGALGIDGDVLTAQMFAQRAANDESAGVWERIAKRLASADAAKVAGLFAIVFIAQSLGGIDAEAMPLLAGFAFENLYIVLICLCVALATPRGIRLVRWLALRISLKARRG